MNDTTPSTTEVLRFLHISDIHFSGYWDRHPAADYELAVRREMLADFTNLHNTIGPIGGILVVGDIANWGIESEYDKATEFLEAAARLIGCAPQAIVCVPGNHDVNRRAQSLAHRHFRFVLRHSPVSDVSDLLLEAMSDADLARTLLAPFEAYNNFAAKYQCDFSADHLTFAPKEFALGALKVRIHGVNSSWLCDGQEKDNHPTESLVAGTFQAVQISDEPMVLSVALSHHPQNWLRDGSELFSWFANAHLVLTGHEHVPAIKQGGTGRPLHIASGAVNPTRSDAGWLPAYNVIELEYLEADSTVAVSIHPRVWQGETKAAFNYPPEQTGPDRYLVPVNRQSNRWERVTAAPIEPTAAAYTASLLPPEDVHAPEHILIHAILKAPTDLRHRAARDLGLIEDSEWGEPQLDRLIVRRAAARDVLDRLAAILEEETLHG